MMSALSLATCEMSQTIKAHIYGNTLWKLHVNKLPKDDSLRKINEVLVL